MIEANELRIGNWIEDATYLTDPNLHCYRRITAYDIYNGVENFIPIPLTPELLEKCGFKPDSKCPLPASFMLDFSDKVKSVAPKAFHAICRDGVCEVDYTVDWKPACNIVKHLHQLQNLYFALTGEELTINL